MASKTPRRDLIAGAASLGVATGAPAYRIIDPHVHVWVNDPKYPWAKETTEPPRQDAGPETLLALMRANGVAKTVIIQVIHYRWDNSYLADVLKNVDQDTVSFEFVDSEKPGVMRMGDDYVYVVLPMQLT